jgi:mannose-6-phosphate isomerase-like protein (cupin superfamily)
MHARPRFPRTIHNPVTGDLITFLASPMSGDGDTLVFRCQLPGGAAGAPLHSHAEMTETFIVESGVIEIDLGGGAIRQLGPGEEIRLEPGTEHGFRNPLESEARFLNVSTPGLELEKFLRAIYGLAADGRAGPDGMPTSPLALAAALADTDMAIAGAPLPVQRAAVRILARIAEWTGAARAVRQLWMPSAAGQAQ